MKADNKDRLKEVVKDLREIKDDIYDYDYDESVLWYISRALESLNRAIND